MCREFRGRGLGTRVVCDLEGLAICEEWMTAEGTGHWLLSLINASAL